MEGRRSYPALMSLWAVVFLMLPGCSDGQSHRQEGSDYEVRTMRYYPDGRELVCLNGDQKYTRSLYGTATVYRLETSDMPLFAVYDGANSQNISFTIGGRDMENLRYCEARYQGGMRRYILRDDAWGKGQVTITALASFHEEGALWQFETEGFEDPPVLEVSVSPCREKEMRSWGDIVRGIDLADYFDPAPDEQGKTFSFKPTGTTSYLFYHHPLQMEWKDGQEGLADFERESLAQRQLAEKVTFNTPDPFLNPLGSVIAAAADGLWDDESHTWLHGAIAWHMTYNGWRQAFVGDLIGWDERALQNFRAYFGSMVTDVPQSMDHPQQDRDHFARAHFEWGTPFFSNGYIGSKPGRNDTKNLYDMNLNFIDILLWHTQWNADEDFLREMWPYLKMHLDWEKRNFDPDGDHLYDAFACIWASDALWYSGGAVTHSSAYNYRGNFLAARIAELIGEDPEPYRMEAEGILDAMNRTLWMDDLGYWAENKDLMGLGRLHKNSALWTIYTPIDCGACTPEQAWRATRYVDERIPHIPVSYRYDRKALKALGLRLPRESKKLYTLSESDWMPYVYSTNNVAHAEVTNTASAYFQSGRGDEGYRIMMGDLLDGMYLGRTPGNLGLGSHYDKAIKDWFRDFGDNVGATSRTLLAGLFGISPRALWGECVLQPAFPSDWEEASVSTPYLSYRFHREGSKDIYEVEQNFAQPLRMILRINYGEGDVYEVQGTSDLKQTIVLDREKLPEPGRTARAEFPVEDINSAKYMESMGLSDIRPKTRKQEVDISGSFNSLVTDIFRNDYLSPRPPVTSLQIPIHGVGNWCTPTEMYDIDDKGMRGRIRNGLFDTGLGLSFLSPSEGLNVVYTSLWDNYPDSVTISLPPEKARAIYLMMAGSTNNMQSRIDNGTVRVGYEDGTFSVMPLLNPINWCPIEQDYHFDDYRFLTSKLHPYRVLFLDGKVMRDPTYSENFVHAEFDPHNGTAMVQGPRLIPCGAGQILRMPLDRKKKLKSLTLTTLSNEVVIGLMGVTLEL